MSDLPLFSEPDNTLAVNAEAALERIATLAYRGDSLVDASAVGRRLPDPRQ